MLELSSRPWLPNCSPRPTVLSAKAYGKCFKRLSSQRKAEHFLSGSLFSQWFFILVTLTHRAYDGQRYSTCLPALSCSDTQPTKAARFSTAQEKQNSLRCHGNCHHKHLLNICAHCPGEIFCPRFPVCEYRCVCASSWRNESTDFDKNVRHAKQIFSTHTSHYQDWLEKDFERISAILQWNTKAMGVAGMSVG